DAGGAVHLHELPPDQGSLLAGRSGSRPGSGYGGTAPQGQAHAGQGHRGEQGAQRVSRLADRTSRIATSPTMKVTATVDRLRREGVEVIDFGAGEPDFGTPAAVNAAAKQAIDEDFTKYTPVAGTAELRRAIRARYEADYGVDYKESEVITSAGGKQALYNT